MLAACARTSAGQADAGKALAAALTVLHEEGKVNNVIKAARWTYLGASQGHTEHDSDCMSDSSLLVFRSVRPGNQIKALSLWRVTAAYCCLCFD